MLGKSSTSAALLFPKSSSSGALSFPTKRDISSFKLLTLTMFKIIF